MPLQRRLDDRALAGPGFSDQQGVAGGLVQESPTERRYRFVLLTAPIDRARHHAEAKRRAAESEVAVVHLAPRLSSDRRAPQLRGARFLWRSSQWSRCARRYARRIRLPQFREPLRAEDPR